MILHILLFYKLVYQPNQLITMTDTMTNTSTNKTARAPSAYNLFVKDPDNRTAHEGGEAKETMRKLATAWKALSADDRSVWDQKAIAAKELWLANGGAPPKKEKKGKTPKKEKGVGRPPSAYNLFVKDPTNRAAHDGGEAKETMRKLAAAWQELGADARSTWDQKASEAKDAWEAEHPTEIKHKVSKRAPNAYNLFIKDPDNRAKHANSGDDAKTLMKSLAVAWNELSEMDRVAWNDKAAEAKKAFDEANPKPLVEKKKKPATKKSNATSSASDEKMTAYQVFMNSPTQLDTYTRANGGKNVDEIRIIMGKTWLGFSDAEKAPWHDQATA